MAVPLKDIFGALKTIPVMREWTERDGNLLWLAELDIGGATVAGLRVRIRVIKSEPERAVMAALEYPPVGKECGLDRIDWRPIHSHNNKGKGPAEHQFKLQTGSHHHQFELNVKEDGISMRKSNLPIAIPMDQEPVNFEKVLEFVAKTYNIEGLGDLRPPDWERALF